jgi:ZU5 domain-containing protein
MARVGLRQRFVLFSSMAAIAMAAIIGCGGGSTSKTQTASATASVSPSAGGTVSLADSSVKLEVPPGAVSSTTMITMTATTDAAPAGITADSAILKFEPDGLVFATPVTVTFTFKGATSPVVYWSNSAGGYDIVGGTVTGDSIAAQVSHFSRGFVGEAPSATDKCNGGLSCATGATCAYGAPSTGSGSSDADGGMRTGAPDASASSGGSTSPSSDPGGGPTTSALSSTDPGSSAGGVAMCCFCTGGAYQCGPCSSTGGPDGGAAACAEGAACVAGSRCGNGGASSGGVDASTASGGARTSSGAPTTSALSTDPGSCCTCGSDGTYHCSACTGTSGGADASTTGPGASCAQGAQCQLGSGMCANGSPDSCEQCVCGADGTYACGPCPGFDGGTTSHDGGGVTTGGGMCVPGAACTPGAAGPCEDTSPDSCLMCSCGGDGKLACVPCGGSTMPDGGAGGPPTCSQGQACAGTGMCMAATPEGTCVGICTCANGAYECGPCAGGADGGAGAQPDAGAAPMCAPGLTCAAGDMCKVQTAQGTCAAICSCANGTYQCGSCEGSADSGAPAPSDAGAAQFSCQLNGPCPQPGAMCSLGSPGNGFQCTCGDSKTLACVHWDAAP